MDASVAELAVYQADVWAVLDEANVTVDEAQAIVRRLQDGNIDGSGFKYYASDLVAECELDEEPTVDLVGCLIGTIAILRDTSYYHLNVRVGGRPAESFFGNIDYGQTPDDNEYSKLAVAWLDEWVAAHS